jgi:hypothetical protein
VGINDPKDAYMPWTIEDARTLLYGVMQPMARLGYVIGVHGSVMLEGKGRDLDLLALSPWDVPRHPELVYVILATHTGVEEVLVPGVEHHGTLAYVWVAFGNKLVDLAVARR